MFLDNDIEFVEAMECDDISLVQMCVALEDLKLALAAGYVSDDIYINCHRNVLERLSLWAGNVVVYDSNIDDNAQTVTLYCLDTNDDNYCPDNIVVVFDNDIVYNDYYQFFEKDWRLNNDLLPQNNVGMILTKLNNLSQQLDVLRQK